MPDSDPKTLVSTEWLARNLADPSLRLIDGSWYLPDMGRDAYAEYLTGHIHSARFVDLDDLSDHRTDIPHQAPPVEKFLSRMRAQGIGDGHQVVIYDGAGLFSAARFWWLFRLMGKTDVAVLDGGLPKWLAEGRPVDSKKPVIRDRHMTAQPNPNLVRDVTQTAAASKLGDHVILDARGAARFQGKEPEPRAGLRSGRIPGSRNVPYKALLNANGTLKSTDELREIFTTAGADLNKPIIASCGSGVTAAIISLALERIGHRDHAIYDGSWSEWGKHDFLNVETGET